MLLTQSELKSFRESTTGDLPAIRSILHMLASSLSPDDFWQKMSEVDILQMQGRAVHALLLHRIKFFLPQTGWMFNLPKYCKVPDRIVSRLIGDNSMTNEARVELAFNGLEEYVIKQADLALLDLQEHGEAAAFASYYYCPQRINMQCEQIVTARKCKELEEDLQKTSSQFMETTEFLWDLQESNYKLLNEHKETVDELAWVQSKYEGLIDKHAKLATSNDVIVNQHKTLLSSSDSMREQLKILTLKATSSLQESSAEHVLALEREKRKNSVLSTEIGHLRRKKEESTDLLRTTRAAEELATERAHSKKLQEQGERYASAMYDAFEKETASAKETETQCRLLAVEQALLASAKFEIMLVRLACEKSDALVVMMYSALQNSAGHYVTRIACAFRCRKARAELRLLREYKAATILFKMVTNFRQMSAIKIQKAFRAKLKRNLLALHARVERDGFLETWRAEVLLSKVQNSISCVREFHALIAEIGEEDKKTLAAAAFSIVTGRANMRSVRVGERLHELWVKLRSLWLNNSSVEMGEAFNVFVTSYGEDRKAVDPERLSLVAFERISSRVDFDLVHQEMRCGREQAGVMARKLLPWFQDGNRVTYTECSAPSCSKKIKPTLNRPSLYKFVCVECETIPYCSGRCCMRDRHAHRGECYINYLRNLHTQLSAHGFNQGQVIEVMLGTQCLRAIGADHILPCRCTECYLQGKSA